MQLSQLLENNKVRQLKPSAFMVLCLLIQKAGLSREIKKFSIRGLAKEWEEDKNLGVVTNKDTIRMILNELDESKLIKLDLENKKLKVLLNYLNMSSS